MNLRRFRIVWMIVPVSLVVVAVNAGSGPAETPLSAEEIIQKAIARAARSEGNGSGREITYTKVTFTEELDKAGKVTDRKERVYEVSFRGGATSRNLIRINGHVPTDDELREQAENEGRLRKLLGPSRTGRGDNRSTFFSAEMAARFRFTLTGRTNTNGREAYQIAFEPRNPLPAENRLIDRFLNRISGTLWIDRDEFELARAEVQLKSEVDLLGGLAACLRKLAFTLERTRVADGIWLDSSSSGDFEGRRLLGSTHIKTRSESRHFRPGGSDSAG